METKRQLVKEVYIKPCAKVFELAEKSGSVEKRWGNFLN